MTAIAMELSSQQLDRMVQLLRPSYAFADVNRSTDSTEKVALDQLLAGNANAYGYFVDKYMRKSLSISWGIVRNSGDAEDIVQDAFIRAYEKIGSMRSGDAFGPWLFRIVTNLSLDLVRRRGRRKEEEITAEIESGRFTDDRSTETLAKRIDEAIDLLPEMQRLVARLYLVEELKHGEIATITGLSEGTIRSHLSHARKKLQQQLEDVYEAGK